MMRIVALSAVPPSHAMRCSTCSVVRGSRRSPRHRRAAFWSVLQPSHLIIIIITVHSPDRLPRVWAAAIIAAGQTLGEVLRHAQVMSRLLLYLSSIYLSSIYLSSIYLSSIYLSSIYLSSVYLSSICGNESSPTVQSSRPRSWHGSSLAATPR